MGDNNWMASEGLDVDTARFNTSSVAMHVQWGQLSGEFVSYESKNNILTMKLSDNKDVFYAIKSAPLEAKVSFAKEIYIIEWKSYNYTIRNVVDGLIISIEEMQDE